ncbi:MAG: hypothetical protein QXM58_03125 [Candidatus Micrarchaeaceae archaeon]
MSAGVLQETTAPWGIQEKLHYYLAQIDPTDAGEVEKIIRKLEELEIGGPDKRHLEEFIKRIENEYYNTKDDYSNIIKEIESFCGNNPEILKRFGEQLGILDDSKTKLLKTKKRL